MTSSLTIVGVNHRSCSLGLRDKLFVEDEAIPGVLGQLQNAGLESVMILSTCDRVEVLFHSDDPAATEIITRVLAAHANVGPEELEGQFYKIVGDEAIRHLFRVTAALESQVIGEPQIFGQVKAAGRIAQESGTFGKELQSVLAAAFTSAKRVRTETSIGERPVTIAASAVDLVRGLHGKLSGLSGLLIGVGDMGEMIADKLKSGGLTNLTITHPVKGRAGHIARNLECHVAKFENLASHVATSDVVVCALGRRHRVLTTDAVRAALRERRHRPIFFIDVAVPGDIEPAVNRLDDAYVYDLADLEQAALAGKAMRESIAEQAGQIVEAEIIKFINDKTQRGVVPALTRLRSYFDEVRDVALIDAKGDAEKATWLLVSRLLHTPSEVLRENAENIIGNDANLVDAVQKLFDLPISNDDETKDIEESEK